MGYRRKKRRSNRGRRGFVFGLLVFIVILLIVSLSTGIFFKVSAIEVEGITVLTADAVREASEIATGENLIFLNKNAAGRKILDALPYAEEVRIRRRLPGTVVIEIDEAKPLCTIEHMGLYWKVSGKGKLLESGSFSGDTGCPEVKGVSMVAPAIGSYIAFSVDEKDKEQILLDIITGLDQEGLVENVGVLDLSKSFEIRFSYLDTYDVILGMPVDIPYKLGFLSSVIRDLPSGKKGTLDLSTAQDSIVHFVPDE